MKFIAGVILLASGATSQPQCQQDIKTCPDGQQLNRNPTDNCNFPLCAGEQDCSQASTGGFENYLICPSGATRKRDGFNNCEFEQCDDPRCELEDYSPCPAPNLHVYTARDPQQGASGCAGWLACPTDDPGNACPLDIKTCPNGQTLNRNPTDNCNFPACMGGTSVSTTAEPSTTSTNQCPLGIKTCPDGQQLNPNPMDNCNYPLCAGEQDCSQASTGNQENYLICPSGTLRKRDGFSNCEFEQCDDPRCELEDYFPCPAPNLHVYMARDPQQGASGCAGWLQCPGTPELTGGDPTPTTMDDGSGSGSNALTVTVGLVASAAVAVSIMM